MKRLTLAALLVAVVVLAGCVNRHEQPSPPRTPNASQQATIAAHGGWDGMCVSLLGRADWYTVTTMWGACMFGDTIEVMVWGQCGDHFVAVFGDAYWGISNRSLQQGRAPENLFAC